MEYKDNILKRCYHWILIKSSSTHAIKVLSTVSFIESIIFPVPPDLILIPMVVSSPKKWFYYAFICTFFSVLGGVVGYFIGSFFWDIIGQPIVDLYHAEEQIVILKSLFDKYGIGLLLIAGFTPLPYKIFTIGSGFLNFNFFLFFLCSIISRGLRFYLLSIIISLIGPKGRKWVENNFSIATAILAIVIILCILIYIKI